MGWIDSRDRHRFEKHCFTKRCGECSLHAFKAFYALPHPPSVPRALHQCQRTALLLIRDSGAASSLFPQSRTARTKVGTFPSNLASAHAKQVVHDKCARCLTQQEECLAPSTTHAIAHNTTLPLHRAGHVSIQPHLLEILTLNRILFQEVVGTPELSCI